MSRHNNRDGTFTRVNTNAIGTRLSRSIVGAVGDYNNDGFDDLLATHFDPSSNIADDLYRNDGGGVFTRLSQSQAGPPVADADNSVDAGWADYDRDGFIDLFVANAWKAPGKDRLYHNNGDGTFTRMTASQVGTLVDSNTISGPCAWADYDNDGYPDLWVGRAFGENSPSGRQDLYHNNRDGTFAEVAAGSLTNNLAVGAGLWADYDNDGYLDLFLSSWNGTNSLHRNVGGQTFADVSKAAGVAKAMKGWAAAWGDYDNDGHLDLLVVAYDTGAQSVLYRNNGDGTFTSVDVGSPLRDGIRPVGVAWGDYDNDGFLDLFIVCGDGVVSTKNLLYHNNGNANHWLQIKPVGTASNHSAIGAKVRVSAPVGGKNFWQMREISGNSGFSGGAGGLLAHFGLGDATNVDLVRIEWPSGNVQELTDVAANQLLTIKENVLITPANPTVSLNGSVTLSRASAGPDASYQWQFNGANLAGATLRTLTLDGVQASQEGRYSVIVTTADRATTNYVYLDVDSTFTQIVDGPLVNDHGNAMAHSWGDYDNDGFLDLLVANGIWNSFGGASAPLTNLFLYHSNGDGTFARVTNSPMTTFKADANAAAFGDYDNDGLLDLLVAIRGIKPNLILWHNNGDGAFTRMTNGPLATDQVIECFGVSWVDCNNDGLLDAFVTAYVQGPGGNDHLYRNNGDGTFTSLNATEAGSIVTDQSGTVAPAWTDYDNDGWPDLVVPIDVTGTSVSDILYHNLGQGTFSRVTGGIIGRQGGPSVSGSWGDYDNDGWPDLFVTSDSGGRSHLYHNLQNGLFEEITSGPLVKDTGRLSYMGCWGDYDNDGFLDLYVAKLGGGLLYHNEGDGKFTSVTTGSISKDTGNCSTASWVDYDNSGFLDLFVGHGSAGGGQISRLYRNNGNGNGWLVVKPVGTKSNRSGIGAKVRATATYAGNTRTQLREIGSTESWKGPNLDAHFGLGNATNVTTLRIEWPSGAVQELANVAPKQFLTIWEPPAIKAAVGENGACLLSIKAEPNRTWRIEGSADLENWELLSEVTNATSSFTYTDSGSPPMVCRFYRVMSE